jgi:hypothetical protein
MANHSLPLTAIPLRSIAAGELCRYAQMHPVILNPYKSS